ncbi:amidophosphoribosyltransferase [Periweissella ghanensis]|nr:amidophosphoribosyltransferase [Periweissella ghanensis]MCM0600018.1 amidophosphoribosyltransferase [Periweissella ghanensis]
MVTKVMQTAVNGLNEECGIFGVWGTKEAAEVTYYGLHALQHRGQEGAGIVANIDGRLRQERGLGLLADVFSKGDRLRDIMGATSAIGHVRYATSGSNSIENIQPLLAHFSDSQLALAHNGNLTNQVTLRRELEDQGAIFQSTSDSEILMHLIRRSQAPTFTAKVKEALNQLRGGFAFLLLTPDALYAALDPHGFRPFVIGQLPTGQYVAASESAALNVVGAKLIRNVQPGELIKIDNTGMQIDHYTEATDLHIDAMEYIYFARPDSDIYGVNVHTARKRMGANLAAEQPVEADIVVGVPNSSLSAASGFAEALHLPNEMGLVKNQYIARTFIEPTQERREHAVKMKLSAVSSVVKDKRVVLVDDSIVRGTTSMYIVRMLREAGAKEVHVRIASPAFKYPSFYGIDMQTTAELMAANYSLAEMTAKIEADSLAFLSVDGLVDAIGLQKQASGTGLTTAYFDGHYPSPIYDYAESMQAFEDAHLVDYMEEPTCKMHTLQPE